MAQDWYPNAEIGNAFSVVTVRLTTGVRAAITRNSGTTDPSSTGTWGVDEVGAVWFDRTNELGAGGDDLGPATKSWEKLTATPTYGWKDKGNRGFFAISPITAALGITFTTATWTDLDLTTYTSARAVAAKVRIETKDNVPAAGVFAEFRKNGVSTDAQTIRTYPQVATLSVAAVFDIELDSGQVMEYALRASGATAGNLSLYVLGYYERI